MSGEPYSEIPLAPRPWWRRLLGGGALACSHAATIALLPDEAPLRNGRRAAVRQPPRPPIRVCVECLLALLEPELKAPERRVVAFEPGAEGVAGYRFPEQDHPGGSGPAAADYIPDPSQ